MKKFYSILSLIILAAVSFAAKAATASVYIDDKKGVYLYTNGDNWDNVEDKLQNGKFVNITFTAGLTWNIDYNHQYVKSVYQIKRNGVVIAEDLHLTFDVGYDFSVEDGDKIEIFIKESSAPTPDNNATVTLDLGSCASDVISSISIDDTNVDFSAGSFQCPVGSMIFVNVNTTAYTITSVTLGGVEMTAIPESDSYYGFVEADATLAVNATPKADAIETVATSSSCGKIYNLQGVEVNPSAMRAGMYIINGKKTYIR